MRNILTDCPKSTPRSWIWAATAINTPTQLGYMPITTASLNATTHVLSLTLTTANQYGQLQVGDEFIFNSSTDYDLVTTEANPFTVLTSSGATVTLKVPETKTVLTTAPTYLIAQVRFRNLTLLPLAARNTANTSMVYVGPNSTAGANWYGIDPSYLTGVRYDSVLGSALRLDQLYGETTSAGDLLYLLFH